MRWGLESSAARALYFSLAGLALAAPWTARAETAVSVDTVQDLQQLSISELANLQVSSATRSSEALSQVPAALYVITHDEIVRSGATTIPQMLRLAPNLFVAQTGAHSWVITARGMSGSPAAENFANKLLVLIDGRSVYDPLFSGVDWDTLDVPPQDIDRIEVISGPGATLWGANAVNGVINIVTRPSYESLGGLVDAEAGTLGEGALIRYGARLGSDLSLRLYAKDFAIGDTRTATGAYADDHWYKPQGGFRLDWTPGADDQVTVEGDGYLGQYAQPGAPDANFDGFDLNAHWDHLWSNGDELQVQSYVNREQYGPNVTGGVPYAFSSYDLQAQDKTSLGSRQTIVWGGEVRDTLYAIGDTANFVYRPASGRLLLGDIFGQDTISLTPDIDLILGLKLEDDPYSGLSPLPSVRATWQAASDVLLWASAQRAIRSPTPFDTAPQERTGGVLFLVGNPDFRPETLDAYEVGVRAQPWTRVSFSASVFYNRYDDLRTVEFSPGPSLPLTFGNGLEGDTYGLEAWGDIQVAKWWRLSPGVDLLAEQLVFKPGASGLLGVAQVGDDPSSHASLRSQMDLGPAVTLDTELRYVGELPSPRVPAYAEMDVSLMWSPTPRLTLGLVGFNLLHSEHLELAPPFATEVPRSAQIELRTRF